MKRLFITFAIILCSNAQATSRPDSHAPIGVTGDHVHHVGEAMFSYRFMQMDMQGNRYGKANKSPEEIVTTTPNQFAGPPTMPPTLRVVPTQMVMKMHMLGAMYAINEKVTLAAMVSYLDNKMEHISFSGSRGTQKLGTFTTHSSGFGDTSLLSLIRLTENDLGRWHATLGLPLPTGSIEETGTVLTPSNRQPTLRLPYPMQLGV